MTEMPIDLLSVPAAHLSFGTTRFAIDDPPAVGESAVYTVRVECTGESTSVKADGEVRYGRKLRIVYVVPEGAEAPPDTDAEQPPLFAEDDGLGEFHPDFSHGAEQ